MAGSKAGQKRHRWEPAHDKFIIRMYKSGEHIEFIAEDVSKKFKIPRSASSTQGRLSILRSKGKLEGRPRGKEAQKAADAAKVAKKAAKTAKKPAKSKPGPKPRANGNGQSHPRTFTVDHGERGKLTVAVEGPILLDEEFMRGLTDLSVRLLNA